MEQHRVNIFEWFQFILFSFTCKSPKQSPKVRKTNLITDKAIYATVNHTTEGGKPVVIRFFALFINNFIPHCLKVTFLFRGINKRFISKSSDSYRFGVALFILSLFTKKTAT